ncbi:hypothetical protein BPOR_0036g00280 [Botrytis porri]|uniref:Uncharacterized protein n=1 Tax=Botrytis porri TaxID=87229 RepID=A0A4Z1L334_9HELO|nr:hypothetical protein BPOR_0036g00280 [Botrytis porri]
MSTSNTTSTVSSAPIVSSSVSVVSSSLTTQSSVSSVPIISSSSIAVSSSPPSSISTISSSSISTISSSTSSISTPSPSSSFSSSQPSISSSSKIPTPPSHHTASQNLSPSHISAEPSSLLQIATPIAIPPPIRPSLSLLTQLQEALDFTSTLLGLFFVSLLTLLLIYWSTLYILRKTVDINTSDTSPIAQSKAKNQTKLHPSNNLPSSPQKKEPWPTDGVQLAGLGSVPESKKDKIEQIAQATEVSELSEAAGRTKEDVVTEADLEFQRGVRDVSGDTDAIERRGGRSYGAL